MSSNKIKAPGLRTQGASNTTHSQNHTKSAQRRNNVSTCFCYEAIKSSLTFVPMSSEDYQAQCLRAAKIAGV